MGKGKKKFAVLMLITTLVISPIIIQTAYAEEVNQEIITENEVNALSEVTEEEVTEPKEEALTEEAVAEPKEEPVTEEAIAEPKAEPVTEEAATEPKAEPVTEEAATEPKEEPVTEEAVAEPKEEPVTEKPKAKSASSKFSLKKNSIGTLATDDYVEPGPDATSGFEFDFTKLKVGGILYELGTKFPNAILIDVTTDEDYDVVFSVKEHEVYNTTLTYSIALVGIAETAVPFGNDIVITIPKNVSYKYVAGEPLNNFQINLRAYGVDGEFEVDTGFIRINKQRNTAEIKIDQQENPTSITFENNGDADNKEYEWEILDENGNIAYSGEEEFVDPSILESLPPGNYTVNLKTTGESQYGNEVQAKETSGTFEIVYGDLFVIHTLVDKDGVETTYNTLVDEGRIGSGYNTEQQYPPGYKLVEVPSNATGEYTNGTITVEYFYEIIKPKLTVNYVDEDGNEIVPSTESTGVYDEEYETENKEFEGYELVEVPSNATGTFGEEDVTVTYVYRLIETELTVRYVDENGKELGKSDVSTGSYGEDYKTEGKEFKGYELVAVPDNASGSFDEDDIVVTYVYRLIETKLTVKYVDEDGNELDESIISKGKYGDKYTSDSKEFEGYELVAVPSNASGEYGEEDTLVTYVYRLIDDETPIPGGGGEEGGTETGGNGTNIPKPSIPGSGIGSNSGSNGSNSGSYDGNGNNPSSLTGSESLAQLPQTGTNNFVLLGYLGGLLVVIGAIFIIFRRKSAKE